MQHNRLTIKINKSSAEVFAYYTNPRNTPIWWDAILQEETSDWPIKIGTIYKSKSKGGIWSEFTVTDLLENEVFELTSMDGRYHVRYTHVPLGKQSMMLEYVEWVDNGELEEPYTLAILEKLKVAIESL